MSASCATCYHNPVHARHRAPHFVGAAEQLAHFGVGLAVAEALERLRCWIEAHQRVGGPFGEPDDVVLVYVDGVGLRAAAGELPLAPGSCDRIEAAQLAGVP